MSLCTKSIPQQTKYSETLIRDSETDPTFATLRLFLFLLDGSNRFSAINHADVLLPRGGA
jgi:hypothetical protein